MGKLLKTAGSIASPMASLTKSAIKAVSRNAKEELVGLPYNQEGNPHPSQSKKNKHVTKMLRDSRNN